MKQHSFDAVSFVLGVLVFGVGIAFLSGMHGTAWLVPVALIGIGLAFAAAAIQRALGPASTGDENESN